MATPHVAGGAALALSARKSKESIERILKSSAQQLSGAGEYPDAWVYGAGLLRVDKAIQENKLDRLVAELYRR